MTVVPGVYELVIPQRATLEEGPIWLPFDGTPIFAADPPAGIYASVWVNDKRTAKLLDLEVIVDDEVVIGDDPENPDSVECRIRLRADWAVTRAVKRSGYWDLLVVWPNGDRDYYLEGPATINRNVTEATP